MKNTKNYLNKTPNDLEKLHPGFSEEGREEIPARHVGVSAKILVSQHIL